MTDYVVNPSPFQGQYDAVPLAALQPNYCEISENFNHDNGKSSVRNGDGLHGRNGLYFPHLLAPYRSGAKMFAPSALASPGALTIVDVTTGGAFTAAYVPAGPFTWNTFTASEFANNLYIWGDGTLGTLGGVYYDGTTWASTPYTLPSAFKPIAAVAYKNRNYLLSYQSSVVAYSEVGLKTGTLTAEDFSSILSTSGYIIGIKNVSISDNVLAQNFLCFITSAGEVIAYQGTYPGGTDFSIAARFKLPSPALSYQSFIDYRGDSLVITSTGLYSLRDLFLKGNQATEDLALSAGIKNRWAQIFGAYTSSAEQYIQGVWDEVNNRLLILFPWGVSRAGIITLGSSPAAGLFLVYDITDRRWHEHPTRGYPNGIESAGYFNDNVYYCSHGDGSIMRKEANTNHTETDSNGGASVGVGYKLRSAPLQTPKFGICTIKGMEVWMVSDQNSGATWKLIYDLGAITSLGQKVPQLSTTALLKPKIDIGGEANFVQYEVAGSCVSGSTGLNIYATNLWYEKGVGR